MELNMGGGFNKIQSTLKIYFQIVDCDRPELDYTAFHMLMMRYLSLLQKKK